MNLFGVELKRNKEGKEYLGKVIFCKNSVLDPRPF